LIEEYDLIYHENHVYDFDDYFDDIIGVTRPDEGVVEKIVLKFNETSLPYVLSKPLHGSQKSIRTENGHLISIEVMQNYELESLLLSFGDRVKIISPQHLLDKINLRLRTAIGQYQSVKD
jgi:predicted DNA-binding transcriptional regulator YafY